MIWVKAVDNIQDELWQQEQQYQVPDDELEVAKGHHRYGFSRSFFVLKARHPCPHFILNIDLPSRPCKVSFRRLRSDGSRAADGAAALCAGRVVLHGCGIRSTAGCGTSGPGIARRA